VHEEHLVQTQGRHVTEALLVVDEGFAVAQEGVVDGVPGAAQLFGDLLNAAPVFADLFREPTTRSVGRQVPRERDATVLLGPGPRRTQSVRAEEPTFVPDQADRTAVDRQVHERHQRPVLHAGHDPALGTAHHRPT